MESPSIPVLATGQVVSDSVETTRELGRRLGAAAVPGTVIALVGELGAGKTQLAKGIAEGLGVASVVNSPTFILMNEHEGRLRMYHIDAYRLEDPEEALASGLLDERQADGTVVIEWADRLAGWLPLERLEIAIGVHDDPWRRTLHWEAHGERHEQLAATLEGEP